MVNRKSLVFALCATASIIGLAGCSDDSGSSSEKPSGNESLVDTATREQQRARTPRHRFALCR